MVTRNARAESRDEPHPVDVAVGTAIRLRRKSLGLSQEALAQALKISFQQVQKYEKGSNRISASRLFETAYFLRAPVELFFRGVAGDNDSCPVSAEERSIQEFLTTQEGAALARSFPRITRASIRRRVVELAKTLADD